jgi:hypothetical protein
MREGEKVFDLGLPCRLEDATFVGAINHTLTTSLVRNTSTLRSHEHDKQIIGITQQSDVEAK